MARSGRPRRRQNSLKEKVRKVVDICDEISDDFAELGDILKEIAESLESV